MFLKGLVPRFFRISARKCLELATRGTAPVPGWLDASLMRPKKQKHNALFVGIRCWHCHLMSQLWVSSLLQHSTQLTLQDPPWLKTKRSSAKFQVRSEKCHASVPIAFKDLIVISKPTRKVQLTTDTGRAFNWIRYHSGCL